MLIRRPTGLLLVLCFILFAAPRDARAQTVTDERAWLSITFQNRGNAQTKWRVFGDTILRSRNGLEELDVFSLRGYVTYALSPRQAIGGGYVFARGYPATGSDVIEHRPFVHYSWTGRTAAGTLALRTRLEFRNVVDNDTMVVRLRQQVRFSHPFRQGSRWALVGYDELFIHFNESNRNVRGIDQNRAFAGVSDTVNAAMRFEVGYLNQYAPGHGGRARMNHVLSGVLVFSF